MIVKKRVSSLIWWWCGNWSIRS